MYILIVGLALISCAIGIAAETTWGNIIHLKNGRPPNAGAALFPNILFVPLAYVAAALALDWFYSGLGLRGIVIYGCAAILVRVYQLFRARAQFRKLNASSTGSSA